MNASTILIVDDEPDLRDAIAFDFRRQKFNVLTASGGIEALKIIETEKVDVVISDVRMPNGDGLLLLDRTKARNPFTPAVIFITGYADISLEEAYDRGADAVFSKPFDRKVLFEAVHSILKSLNQQFLRKTPRLEIDTPIGIHFVKSNLSIGAAITNLGRGGIFVALRDQFPEKFEPVEFRLQTDFEPRVLVSGSGIVRWIRSKVIDSLPTGCGIEFTALEKESARQVVELINFIKTKTYIPQG